MSVFQIATSAIFLLVFVLLVNRSLNKKAEERRNLLSVRCHYTQLEAALLELQREAEQEIKKQEREKRERMKFSYWRC